MKRKCLAVGITLLFIGTIVIPSSGQKIETRSFLGSRGNTLYVGGNGPGNYTKIQDAINNASNGDTVFVFHGTYHEKLLIKKSIHLLGENRETTVINYEGHGISYPVVNLSADDIVFDNFSLNVTSGESECVALYSASHCKIHNNTIFGSMWGIGIYHNSNMNEFYNNSFHTISCALDLGDFSPNLCSGNVLHDNSFTNTGGSHHIYEAGLLLEKSAANNTISHNYFHDCTEYGILSLESKNNDIEHNTILGNTSKSQYGMGMKWSEEQAYIGNIIRKNTIADCAEGIYSETSGHTITGNAFENDSYALDFSNGPINLIVKNNTIRGSVIGMDIWYAVGTVIEGNTFQKSKYGLVFDFCQNLTIKFNNFSENTWAIAPETSSKNVISRNNFIGNTYFVMSFHSRNFWWKNYWDKPRFLPKLILGLFPFTQFDWHPARQPN